MTVNWCSSTRPTVWFDYERYSVVVGFQFTMRDNNNMQTKWKAPYLWLDDRHSAKIQIKQTCIVMHDLPQFCFANYAARRAESIEIPTLLKSEQGERIAGWIFGSRWPLFAWHGTHNQTILQLPVARFLSNLFLLTHAARGMS